MQSTTGHPPIPPCIPVVCSEIPLLDPVFADVVAVTIEKRFRSVTEVLVADSTAEWIRVHHTLKKRSNVFKLQRTSVPSLTPPGRRIGLRNRSRRSTRKPSTLPEDVWTERGSPELEEPAPIDDAIRSFLDGRS
nr:hypothetical protein [Natrinema gelatinilyticum]